MGDEQATTPHAGPVLTIGVASYDVGALLAHGLATYADPRLRGRLEVIVVNDGSTDDTHDVAARFVEAEPSIFRLVDKENGGHGSAVNAALAAARGRWFRAIDGDDWADTEELVRLVGQLEALDADLVVDVKCEVDEATGTRHVFPLPRRLPQLEPLALDGLLADPALDPFLMIHTLTVRTDVARAAHVLLPEHCFYVDLLFVAQCVLASRTVCVTDTMAYQYRVGSDTQSVADQGYVRHFDDHTRVTQALLALLDDADGLSADRRVWLSRRCVQVVNTHMNVALVFDPDRRRGWERARAFRAWLREAHPQVAMLTAERYLACRLLHVAGARSQRDLDRLTGRTA